MLDLNLQILGDSYLENWLAEDVFVIEPWFIQRDVVPRLKKLYESFKKTHITDNHLTIRVVLYKGEYYIIDGNTRLTLMNPNNPDFDKRYGVVAPEEFTVIVFESDDEEYINSLYYSFDNAGAEETTPNIISGLIRDSDLKNTFRSKRLKIGQHWSQMLGFLQHGHSSTINDKEGSVDQKLNIIIKRNIELLPKNQPVTRNHIIKWIFDYYVPAVQTLDKMKNVDGLFNVDMSYHSGFRSALLTALKKYSTNKKKMSKFKNAFIKYYGTEVRKKETRKSNDPLVHFLNLMCEGSDGYAYPVKRKILEQGGRGNTYYYTASLYYIDLFMNNEKIPETKEYKQKLEDLSDMKESIRFVHNFINR